MGIEIKLLSPADADFLEHVTPQAFDDPIDPRAAEEFLNDPRHHLAAALDDGFMVEFASAVNYVHPDKPKPDRMRGSSKRMQPFQGGRILRVESWSNDRTAG